MVSALSFFASVVSHVLSLTLEGVPVAYLLAVVLSISLVLGAVLRTVSGGGGVASAPVSSDRFTWSHWSSDRTNWGKKW